MVTPFEDIYDQFVEDVDIELIETKSDLYDAVYDWINPRIKRKEQVTEKLTEEFWKIKIKEVEELPERIAYEVLPEKVGIRRKVELAIERAMRFPTTRERWMSLLGSLRTPYMKGLISLEEMREIWKRIKL